MELLFDILVILIFFSAQLRVFSAVLRVTDNYAELRGVGAELHRVYRFMTYLFNPSLSNKTLKLINNPIFFPENLRCVNICASWIG